MNEVTFPIFNFKLNINPVMIKFLNINIYWYAFFIVLSIVIGLLICKKNDGKYQINFENILELSIFTLPMSIIGARIYYVIFSINEYLKNPLKIFNIRDGGLAIYGGIIAAIIIILIYCKIKKLKVLDVLDYVVPCLALRSKYRKMGQFF